MTCVKFITGWLWSWKHDISIAVHISWYICSCLWFFSTSCWLGQGKCLVIHNKSWSAEQLGRLVLFCLFDVMSPFAEWYLQKHKDFRPDRLNAFVCDITSEQLTENMEPSSADIVTMVICYALIMCLFWIIYLTFLSLFLHYFTIHNWEYKQLTY